MTSTTNAACPRESLVEALHDGRLGPQDSASMERHVATCARCAGHLRELARIRDVLRAPKETVTPLGHQRARLALLQQAGTTKGARESRRAPPTRLLLAAAALVALCLSFWGGRASRPERVTLAMSMGQRLRVEPPQETKFKPSDDARFSRSHEEKLDVVTLEQGSLDITLRPLAEGERFVVRTTDAEIEVRGTALRVEAEGGKVRSVAAVSGTVEVQVAGFFAVIPSGGSWRATEKTTTAQSKLDQAAWMAPTGALPLAASMSAQASAYRKSAARTPTERPKAPSTFTNLDNPEAPRVVEPQPSEPVAKKGPSESSRAFADAMRSLRRGDYDSSAEALDSFAATYPGDARADEALYLRAIALQRAGKTEEAKAAAKLYLTSRPNGAHRTEAQRIAGP